MRGDERMESPGKTINVQRPVDPRLIRRRRTREAGVLSSGHTGLAEYIFSDEAVELTEREIAVAAMSYMKGYRDGVDSVNPEEQA